MTGRELYKTAILSNAAGMIMFHNHPSSDLQMSKMDRDVTEKMMYASLLLDIAFYDHIIVAGGTGETFSMRENVPELFEPSHYARLISRVADGVKEETPYRKASPVTYEILQIKDGSNGEQYRFWGMNYVQKKRLQINVSDYESKYQGELKPGETLDTLYERFNLHRPEDFTGHSLSVSDVIVLESGGDKKAFYVDYVGFSEQKDFFEERFERTERQKKIIADFREKTEKYFNPVEGMNAAEVEERVRKYLMNTTIGQNLLIQIGEVVVYGSRCRGTEKTDSDIDIVFEYKGDIREDDLFNLFHEDRFSVGIHKVDINPIKEDKSGNIAEFLQQATIYMESEMAFSIEDRYIYIQDAKAASMEELEERTEKVRIIGKTHNMDIVPHSYRQLDALNTSLPTGARFVDTMRTITSEELSIFIPFNVQEIHDDLGYCYGFNKVSKNLIIGNRKLLKNGNGMVFGVPGSGKSYNEKSEMGQVLCFSKDDIIVVDPMGEYKDIAAAWGGQYINLTQSAENVFYVNPFYVPDVVPDIDRFVAEKAEFAYAICEQALKPVPLTSRHIAVIDKAVSHLFRIPRGRLGEDLSSAIWIKKSDCILLDEGQTVITCLKRDGELWGYALDQRKNINEKEKVKLDITKLEKAFAPVGDDRVKMIGKLKPEYAAIFPSFHEGQEIQKKSSVPDLVPEKTVEKVLSLEKMKERYQSPEYIPVTFDMETQMVAESPNLYIANLPKEQQESKDFVRCICLDKETTSLSDDGKRLLAYLKRSDMSEITELDPNGKELRKYVKKNEEIATECLKHQRGKWNTEGPSMEKRLLQKSVSTSKNKKL